MKSPLRLQKKSDHNSQPEIEESIRGVEFSFFYTGRRQAKGSAQIELYITSIITDWNQQQYIRKAWYMGDSKDWKKCIENHVRQHLLDVSAGAMLVMRMMQDFEVKQEHYKPWDKYYK